MNKKIMYISIIVGILLVGWFLYSWLSIRNIEEPQYKVVSVAEGYEVREYDSYIIAETTVTGAKDRNTAARKGFPIVAGYIFGNNTRRDSIAMTVPVNTEELNSEKIAMTVPVNTEPVEIQGTYKISFVLPSEYTLESLPTPNDSRVVIKVIPSRKVAIRKFSWSASESSLQRNEEKLLSALKRDGVVTVGAINVARYNPPWTIPFMLRNEIQIEVKL